MPNVLLLPPGLNFTAQRILRTSQIPGSADNDINVLLNIVQPLIWQRLTDSDAYFLGRLKMGLMGLDRMAPEMDFYQDETSKD